MNIETIKKYCLSKPEAVETFPAGSDASVFKVRHKMFASVDELQGLGRVNLKCDPEEALVLREDYDAILPGHHMNKRHWNTILLDDSLDEDHIEEMIDQSYALVVRALMDNDREDLESKYSIEELYPPAY